MRYIGIDPGQAGGLVLLNCKGACLEWAGMPDALAELWLLLARWSQEAGVEGVHCFIEKVRSSPQMSKPSIFVFGYGVGTLHAFLVAAGIPFTEVGPQKWQLFMGVRDKTGARPLKDVDTTAKKHRHKAKAETLFPSVRWNLKTADAALIAEYGRRMEEGFGAELPS